MKYLFLSIWFIIKTILCIVFIIGYNLMLLLVSLLIILWNPFSCKKNIKSFLKNQKETVIYKGGYFIHKQSNSSRVYQTYGWEYKTFTDWYLNKKYYIKYDDKGKRLN